MDRITKNPPHLVCEMRGIRIKDTPIILIIRSEKQAYYRRTLAAPSFCSGSAKPSSELVAFLSPYRRTFLPFWIITPLALPFTRRPWRSKRLTVAGTTMVSIAVTVPVANS